MSHGQQSDQTPPSPDEVRAALNCLTESELFRSSPQLASFLRFVVEAVLRGEAKRIKGYTIGIEALGRGPGFNPQVDPIVRVEATRLRRNIAQYYGGPGVADPLVIEILRGSYVPTFHRRKGVGRRRAQKASFEPSRARLIFIAIVALVAIGAAAYTAIEWRSRGANARLREPTIGTLRPGNGLPTIVIQSFEILGTPLAPSLSAETLREKVRDALSRFDIFNVEFDPTRNGDPAFRPRHPLIDYRLSGTIEHRDDGTTGASFRLLDAAEGKLVWSRTFEPFPAEVGRAAIEEHIVFSLATTLMLPYGVVRSHERVKYLSSRAGDPRNRCIVETLEAFRSFDPFGRDNARACLESMTAIDPSFASGFAYLSAVYVREFQFGLGARPDGLPLLDWALIAARRAVELNPENSRAYQMLFIVLFVRREIGPAFAAADKAIALNKYNLIALSEYGGRLIMVGEVDRGLEMLRRSADYGTVLPSWHHFYMFLGVYLRGDLPDATYHANQATGADYPLGHLARALVAAAANDKEKARQAFDRLVAIRPAWASQTRQELERYFPSAAIVERLERDLAAAGLAAANPKE